MKLGYLGEKIAITCRQGGTLGPFRARMTNADANKTPVDLTGAVIRGTVRRAPGDAVALASFVVTITDPTDGRYEFGLPADVTATLPAGVDIMDAAGKLVWDLELVDSQGRVTPLYFGPFTNVMGVTRDEG